MVQILDEAMQDLVDGSGFTLSWIVVKHRHRSTIV